KNKNWESRQTISRRTLDKRKTGKAAPAHRDPCRITRAQFEPRDNHADERQRHEDQLLSRDDFSLVWLSMQIADEMLDALPRPGRLGAKNFSPNFHESECASADLSIDREINAVPERNTEDREPLPAPAALLAPLLRDFHAEDWKQGEPVRARHRRKPRQHSGFRPAFRSRRKQTRKHEREEQTLGITDVKSIRRWENEKEPNRA